MADKSASLSEKHVVALHGGLGIAEAWHAVKGWYRDFIPYRPGQW